MLSLQSGWKKKAFNTQKHFVYFAAFARVFWMYQKNFQRFDIRESYARDMMFVYITGSLHTGEQKMIKNILKQQQKSLTQMQNSKPYTVIMSLSSELFSYQKVH